MDWTTEDTNYLLSFYDKVDSDDIKIKNQIKKKLVSNRYIAHVLNNKELEESGAEPDEYFGINILPFYLIHPTQHNVQNFICYEVSYNEIKKYNKNMKYLQIIFYILCEQGTAIDDETSLPRHDLLAALITDQFNWTHIFGSQIHLVSDKPSITDSDYVSRTLIFEQLTDNNIVKKNIINNKDLL